MDYVKNLKNLEKITADIAKQAAELNKKVTAKNKKP